MLELNESMNNCNLFSFSLHKGKASLKRIRDLLRVGTIQFGHLGKKKKKRTTEESFLSFFKIGINHQNRKEGGR